MFADATDAVPDNDTAGTVVVAAVVCAGQTRDCTGYDCRTVVDDLCWWEPQCRLRRTRCSVDSHDYLMRLDKNNNSENHIVVMVRIHFAAWYAQTWVGRGFLQTMLLTRRMSGDVRKMALNVSSVGMKIRQKSY